MDKQLEKLGFHDAPTEVYPRIIASVTGMEKQGKSHFSMGAPGPVAIYNMDIGLEGVVHKFAGDKDIMVKDMPIPEKLDDAKKVWEDFKKAYYITLQSKAVRSIIVDTATELWELLRMARLGKLSQVLPHQYGPVNAEFRKILKDSYESYKNLILIHKMKKKYVNDKWNGNFERSGFNDIPYVVQVNVNVYRDDEELEDGETSPEFVAEIVDCRQNPDLVGFELRGGMCEFAQLATLVMPDTDYEDWE